MATISRTAPKSKLRVGRLVFWGILIALFVAAIAFGVVYYQKYNQLSRMPAADFANRERDKILKEISAVYTLPSDESPLFATISPEDVDTLKVQYPFFKDAVAGDTYALYQKAQLAIVYRPSTKQLIKVGPLALQSSLRIATIGSDQARQSVSQKLSEQQIKSADLGTAKATYDETIVVDLSGQKADDAAKLAEIVGGKVGAMPAGEDKPADTDLLIIAGTN